MSAPKPEMLEKADAIHRSLVPHGIRLYGDPCPVCRIIALALEEAEEDAVNLAAENARLLVERAEALRASEASVESLRKGYKLLEDAYAVRLAELEAARAEATKAEREACATDGCTRCRVALMTEPAPPICSWPVTGLHVDGCEARSPHVAAIRAPRPSEPRCMCYVGFVAGGCPQHGAPSSPTPPTSPPCTCATGFTNGECKRHTEPTPPREEPRR